MRHDTISIPRNLESFGDFLLTMTGRGSNDSEESAGGSAGRPLTAILGTILVVVLMLNTIAHTAKEPWKRCDPGRWDAPRYLADENRFREAIMAESVTSTIATLLLAVVASIYLYRLAVETLPRFVHWIGIYLLVSYTQMALFSFTASTAPCAGAPAFTSPAIFDVFWFFAFLSEYLNRIVILQVCVLIKAEAAQGIKQNICAWRGIRKYLFWSWILFLPAWFLFSAFMVSRTWALAGGLFVMWSLFLACFATFTLKAALTIWKARQDLEQIDVNAALKANLMRSLAIEATAVITANLSTILFFVALATIRIVKTIALEFFAYYLDQLNNTVTVLVLSGLLRRNIHDELAVLEVARVWTLLEVARERIKTELGYDIGPRLADLAEAAFACQQAYMSIFEEVEKREPVAVAALLEWESEHMYGDMLLPDSKRPAGVQPVLLRQAAEDADALRRQAEIVQEALKNGIAPGTPWARTVMGANYGMSGYAPPEGPPRLLRGSENFNCCIDACYDPGIKGKGRMLQKARFKYGEDVARVKDVARLAMHCDSALQLCTALPRVLSLFEVVEVENRFAKPTALGWRDMTILVRLPVESAGPPVHIAEIQLQLTNFYRARLINHKHYRIIRSILPQLGVQPDDMDRVQNLLLNALDV